MAETLKNLAQANPSAGTLTDIYTVSASAMVSSIVICNQGCAATFRLAHAIAGAAATTAQYLYYDQSVPAKQTFVATVGLSLAATDVIRAYASSGSVSFNIYGVEVA